MLSHIFVFVGKCYSCGDVDAKTYVDKAKCKIPASGANATDDDAKVVECLNGICVVSTLFLLKYMIVRI